MTEEDLWYFKINGFYRIPEALPAVLVGRLNGATDEQIEEMAEPIVWENKDTRTPSAVRRLSKALNRDRVYQEAGSQPIILDALEDILGPNVELLTNKHNHVLVKPSGAYPVPWHSGEQPYDPVLITALIYLEEATTENGCVRIVPGSHNRPFRKDRRPQKQRDDFQDSENYFRSVPIPMPAATNWRTGAKSLTLARASTVIICTPRDDLNGHGMGAPSEATTTQSWLPRSRGDEGVPEDPRVQVRPMFGNLAGFANGNMFIWLFGSAVFVRLGEDDRTELLK